MANELMSSMSSTYIYIYIHVYIRGRTEGTTAKCRRSYCCSKGLRMTIFEPKNGCKNSRQRPMAHVARELLKKELVTLMKAQATGRMCFVTGIGRSLDGPSAQEIGGGRKVPECVKNQGVCGWHGTCC